MIQELKLSCFLSAFLIVIFPVFYLSPSLQSVPPLTTKSAPTVNLVIRALVALRFRRRTMRDLALKKSLLLSVLEATVVAVRRF